MIRSGSSLNESCGVPGVRRTPARRSARPPNGSTSSFRGSLAAIAFTVKSRLARSSTSEVPYSTSGLRESRS